jgi:Xaa-Pro aminopeptidase
MSDTTRATIRAGAPAHNPWLLHVAPFPVGDAAAYLELPGKGTAFLVRDIEAARAKAAKIADRIVVPADFAPAGGLPSDRDIATAIATAEFVRREGVKEIWADRSLPFVFADALQKAGVTVRCDPEMGVRARRMKTPREIDCLRAAQRKTEQAVEFACRLIARAAPDKQGVLQHDGAPLTSERVIGMINIWLLEHGMGVSNSIVAGGAQGGDCHNRGKGPLRTGEPVIIDVFPMDPATHFFGDCTRTVVHGEPTDEVATMHRVVVEAKRAAIAMCREGVTAEQVHRAAIGVIEKHGYSRALPPDGAGAEFTSMQHGTGHGVGLDVHEPPLLDDGGPELLRGECLTVEPGLYNLALGGVRVEDMVIVGESGCDNLNSIPEGFDWS